MAQSDEIVVDAKTAKNRNPYFLPLGRNLQGEVSVLEYHSDKIPGHLAQAGGVLPGERLKFNPKTGAYRLEHKLDMPEHKEVADAVRRTAARFQDLRQKTWDRFGELRTGTVEKEDIPTWLWWIRRMIDARKLVLVSGDVPTLEKIRTMGDVSISADPSAFNDSEKAQKYHTLPQIKELAGSGSGGGGNSRN